MGPGTGRSGGPRATPADTLRALAGDISEYLTSRGELLQQMAADPAYAPRASSGREALSQIINRTPEEARARFDEVFASPFMGAMPVAGIFAGVGAKTADLAKLRVAEDMAGKGADPEAIRAATGWFQGPDQKWRFEIPDNAATATLDGKAALSATGPVDRRPMSHFLKHEELFEAYPELADAQTVVRLRAGPYEGWFSPGRDGGMVIDVGAARPQDARSVMLHELQHGVQTLEGFAPGSSPRLASGPWAEAKGTLGAIDNYVTIAPYLKEAGGNPWKASDLYEATHGTRDRYDGNYIKYLISRFGGKSEEELDALIRRNETVSGLSNDEIYRRTAGEVEARDVQSRADFTPEQRAATAPYSSQGIAPEDMIVLPRSGGVQASVDDYLARINPGGKRIPEGDRPNLGMGDMYGMLPKGAREVGKLNHPELGPVRLMEKDGNVYAVARNPDIGEQDVIGYIMRRGDGTELAVVNEAQGAGIGAELQYQYRRRDPYAPSGGLTEAGERTARRTYDRLVNDGIIPRSE